MWYNGQRQLPTTTIDHQSLGLSLSGQRPTRLVLLCNCRWECRWWTSNAWKDHQQERLIMAATLGGQVTITNYNSFIQSMRLLWPVMVALCLRKLLLAMGIKYCHYDNLALLTIDQCLLLSTRSASTRYCLWLLTIHWPWLFIISHSLTIHW